MRLALTFCLPRRRAGVVDVVVDAPAGSTVADLTEASIRLWGAPIGALTCNGTPLAGSHVLGHPPVLHGAVIVVDGPTVMSDEVCHLELAVLSGPDAGRSSPLGTAPLMVGRSPACGLTVGDPALSREHAWVRCSGDAVILDRLATTNDPGPRTQVLSLDEEVHLGTSVFAVRARRPPVGLGTAPGDGTVRVTPARAQAVPWVAQRLEAPGQPRPVALRKFPWVTALVPLPVAGALAVFLGPQLLAFALLGPVMAIATAAGERRAARREWADEQGRFAGARAAFDARTAAHLDDERDHRASRAPGPVGVLDALAGRGELWGEVATDSLVVRVGVGAVPARTEVIEADGPRPLVLDGAPVTIPLRPGTVLALAGRAEVTTSIARWVLGQLLVRYPPSAVRVVPHRDHPWLARTPHTRSSAVLTVGSDGEADIRIVAVGDPERAPAGALVIDARNPSRARVVVPGEPALCDVTLDLVGPWWGERVGRALAPLREDGPDGTLPRSVRLVDVLGEQACSEGGVLASWGRGPGPVATLGVTAAAPWRVDLCSDGPHLLVAGTTGAGKSELLQALVLSLTLACAPEDVSFVLVDYKGGSAFGPTRGLPHVLGVVTDLDEHLTARALTSLRAEIKRRERAFAEVGARDLGDYERLRGAHQERLGRLVLVVDEFRLLAEELPEFLSGLVALAALGRSLGIHLVLATQRPGGAVSPDIRANVNLRIALRVRDPADSLDVVDCRDAASLPADVPGRAVFRTGSGEAAQGQVARVSGPTRRAGPRQVLLREQAAGSVAQLDADPEPSPEGADQSTSPTDLDVLVAAVSSAHERRGAVERRAPWLPPLPDVLSASDLLPVPGRAVLGVADLPMDQCREAVGWGPGDGPWLVVGGPRSGRTTVVRRLVGELPHAAQPVCAQVIDGGTGLSDLGALPWVGTVADASDHQLVARLLDRLEAEVRDGAPIGQPRTLLVVDGWERCAAVDPLDPSDPRDRILALARDGSARGVDVLVTGDRSVMTGRLPSVAAEVLILPLADPAEALLAGLTRADLPQHWPQGRAVRVRDRVEVQLALPADPAVAAVSSGASRPWRLRTLPSTVTREDVASGAWAIGLAGDEPGPYAVPVEDLGGALLVVGPARSGRTNTLMACALGARLARRAVVFVAGRGRQSPPGVECLGTDDVARLAARRAAHPDLVVLVDDAETVDATPVGAVLSEIADLAARDGGLVVAATSSQHLATTYRGLVADLARRRNAVLLSPVSPGDAHTFGVPVVRGPRPRGRAVVVVDGAATEVQVALCSRP